MVFKRCRYVFFTGWNLKWGLCKFVMKWSSGLLSAIRVSALYINESCIKTTLKQTLLIVACFELVNVRSRPKTATSKLENSGLFFSKYTTSTAQCCCMLSQEIIDKNISSKFTFGHQLIWSYNDTFKYNLTNK